MLNKYIFLTLQKQKKIIFKSSLRLLDTTLFIFIHMDWDILKGVIWCDFKFCFLFGVLQADCA